jgi:ribonucleoside-diphosphate reductase beta chain
MLLDSRLNLYPSEYPVCDKFIDGIQQSYWLHTEYDYSRDIDDIQRMDEAERQAVIRDMLAISQVEVGIKTYWMGIHLPFPKPEIGMVGSVFADSEVRHLRAYSHLLNIMGLQQEFQNLQEVPCIFGRLGYLKKYKDYSGNDPKSLIKSLSLFTLFVENVSLFSQFFIFYQYAKQKNWLMGGMATAVAATAMEEQLHAEFGMFLINTLKEEYPDCWDGHTERSLVQFIEKAYLAECGVLDWILEKPIFIKKGLVKDYLKHRFNLSMEGIGLKPIFKVRDKAEFEDYELTLKSHTRSDFFNERPNTYGGQGSSFSADNLF